MRRSVREAIVGFSLLAAISSGVGLSMWLRGLSLTRQNWTVEARFQQADGLAVRSPVVFRGVMVGTVRSVAISSDAVVAELEITNPQSACRPPGRGRPWAHRTAAAARRRSAGWGPGSGPGQSSPVSACRR